MEGTMKKIILTLSCLAFATFVHAKDLATVLETDLQNAAKMSKNVEGVYYSNNDKTANVIATGHSQGTKAFATGSMTTSIYEKNYSKVPTDDVTAELFTAEPSTYSDNETGTIFKDWREK
jgi:hypothetical protein